MEIHVQNDSEKNGKPLVYPAPRYSIDECLVLLKECRETFYLKVRSGRYHTTQDGRRRYMTHEQLLDAAQGDSGQEAA